MIGKYKWLIWISIPALLIASGALYLNFRSETINVCAEVKPTKIERFTYYAGHQQVDRQSATHYAEIAQYCEQQLTFAAYPRDVADALGKRTVTTIRVDGAKPETISFHTLPNRAGTAVVYRGQTYLVAKPNSYPSWPVSPATLADVPK